MKTDTDGVRPCKVGFTEFCSILKSCLVFRKGTMWDTDTFNEEYASFRLCIGEHDYDDSLPSEVIVKSWAQDYYQDASKDTHDYWLAPRS